MKDNNLKHQCLNRQKCHFDGGWLRVLLGIWLCEMIREAVSLPKSCCYILNGNILHGLRLQTRLLQATNTNAKKVAKNVAVRNQAINGYKLIRILQLFPK